MPCHILVNQCLRHNLGYKQKIIQFIRRNQVYFSSSNVSTDTTVIVKDYMLSEKFTIAFSYSTILEKLYLTLAGTLPLGLSRPLQHLNL